MHSTAGHASSGTTFGGARDRQLSLFTALLWAQGLYYLVTGIWPLVSIRTFLMVTGPKTDHLQSPNPTETDHWLVMTVGSLIVAVAVTLLYGAWRRGTARELAVLAIASAIALTAIDVIYVTRQVILPIYLADAAIEVVLVLAWVVTLVREPHGEAAGRGTA
jgi:hypothetical protein